MDEECTADETECFVGHKPLDLLQTESDLLHESKGETGKYQTHLNNEQCLINADTIIKNSLKNGYHHSEEPSTCDLNNVHNKPHKEQRNPLRRQLLVSIGPNILILCGGMVAGYSAILLPQLQSETSDVKITKSQQIWIASVPPVAMAIGCIVSGWSLEKLGRLKTNIIATVIMIIGWAMIYFGSTAGPLIAGRLISGFSLGYNSPACIVYVAEISHPKYRALLLSATPLFISLGLLVVHGLGSLYSWRLTALVGTFFPVICMVCFALSPESHVWFANRGDFQRAEQNFYWFRGDNAESQEEFMKMLKGKQLQQPRRSVQEVFRECCRAEFVKPFLIMILFFGTMQLSGNNAIVFYSVSIMQSTAPGLNNYAAMIIVDFLRVVMAVVGCIVSKKFNVRPLTMVSGFGTATSLLFLSISVILAQTNPDNFTLSIIPIFGLLAYIILMSIGLMSLPWALCGELFPPSTKGIGGGTSSCINFLIFFIVVKTSPDMFETLGTAATFALYGLFVLTGTSILYYVLPETKNRTLKDIEAFFKKNCDTK